MAPQKGGDGTKPAKGRLTTKQQALKLTVTIGGNTGQGVSSQQTKTSAIKSGNYTCSLLSYKQK